MYDAVCVCGRGKTDHGLDKKPFCFRYRPAWRTKAGSLVEISQMSQSHLRNTINLIRHKATHPMAVRGYSELLDELNKRVREALSGLGD